MSTDKRNPTTNADELLLNSFGYDQELHRRMSGFSNFAISFSIICILAGGITSLQLGTSAVGGAAAGIIWPIGVFFCFLVALCMAQIASAYPTAGGLYHWSAILGGKGWGWATAWFNLLGLIFVTAAVDVGVYGLFNGFFGPYLGYDPAGLTVWHQVAGIAVILATHAALNHFGIKLTTLLTDFSGYLIFATSIGLTLALVAATPSWDFGKLFAFSNFSGASGGGVWPENTSGTTMILLALLWPVYTITGYDASAHTSEETVDAARNAPQGILRSVYLSGIFGWIMVCAIVLAIPNVNEAAAQGGNIFFWLIDLVLPGWLKLPLLVAIWVANYICGLACLTSCSRMVYAFARDGGLPGSKWLRTVSPTYRTPVIGIWVSALLVLASTVYAPAYATLTCACVIFLYLSYVMPTAAGLLAYGKTWTRMGPFDLGPLAFRIIGSVAILFVGVIVWAGVQPPNEKALYVTAGLAILLPIAWVAGVNKSFAGPPVIKEIAPLPSSESIDDPTAEGAPA